MRKFKIRKVKATKVFTISPQENRVQLLTKIAADLERYTPEEMPEVDNIKKWVRKELAKILTKEKVNNLFYPKNTAFSH